MRDYWTRDCYVGYRIFWTRFSYSSTISLRPRSWPLVSNVFMLTAVAHWMNHTRLIECWKVISWFIQPHTYSGLVGLCNYQHWFFEIDVTEFWIHLTYACILIMSCVISDASLASLRALGFATFIQICALTTIVNVNAFRSSVLQLTCLSKNQDVL